MGSIPGPARAASGMATPSLIPPFGTKKGGGLSSRTDFTFPTSNKQFCLLQPIYRALRPGGRAAVVLPDNVLFEGNVGKQIRADLMDKGDLHTILQLPPGNFPCPGRKAHCVHFARNLLQRVQKHNQGMVTAALRNGFAAPRSQRAPSSSCLALAAGVERQTWVHG